MRNDYESRKLVLMNQLKNARSEFERAQIQTQINLLETKRSQEDTNNALARMEARRKKRLW